MYLNEYELLPSVQSAYRQFFSTETAVLKVVSDVLTAMDRGQITLLGMFDLSAAFDTVDQWFPAFFVQRAIYFISEGMGATR